MKLGNLRLLAACLAGLCLVTPGFSEDKTVEIKALKMTVPDTWEKKPASNRLRLAEFQIKPVEGEGAAEVVVYSFGGGGGGVDANIQRWVGQFSSDGRKVKATQGKSPQGEYVLVDISGTYNQPVGPPIRRQTKAVENSRMLAAIINLGDEGNYFVKFTGGKKSVEQHAKAFRKSFGASEEAEKAYEK